MCGEVTLCPCVGPCWMDTDECLTPSSVGGQTPLAFCQYSVAGSVRQQPGIILDPIQSPSFLHSLLFIHWQFWYGHTLFKWLKIRLTAVAPAAGPKLVPSVQHKLVLWGGDFRDLEEWFWIFKGSKALCLQQDWIIHLGSHQDSFIQGCDSQIAGPKQTPIFWSKTKSLTRMAATGSSHSAIHTMSALPRWHLETCQDLWQK